MAKKQHTRGSAGRKALIPVLSVLVLAALAVGIRFLSDPFPRLEVAGFRVTEEEYLRAMYQARNDVLSDHAAAGISLKDWSAETPLGDPCDLAMERTLEILSEYYAVSALAVERGDLADAGYDAMVRDLEEFNRQRQEALESGGMVTGLPSFAMEDYITYRASNLRLLFCSDPDNPENQVTEEEILRRYEADRDALYRQPDSVELSFLVADFADDTLEQSFQALQELALEKGDLAAALEEMPQLKGYYQEVSVDAGNYSAYVRSHGDILDWSADLQPGEISRVFRQDDRLCLMQCLQRIVQPYAPLEDVRSVVEQSIRESRYDALIAERIAATQIRGDLQSLYRFTAEQFS